MKKKIAIGLGTVFGTVSDICQPIGPYSEYVCIGSFVLVLVLLFFIFVKKVGEKLTPLFMKGVVISSIIFVVSLVMLVLQQFGGGENKGALANFFPAIEKMQDSLNIIQKDTAEIKQTTKYIKQDTEEIKSTVINVDSKIDKLNENIGKQGGIKANPETPEDYYHNARIYEINGDYGNARRSYLKYFSFPDVNKLDPHLRFQAFLKIQEGREGAKEVYREFFGNSSKIVDKYAMILLENNAQKEELLNNFIATNKNFAHAYLELSKLFSEITLGNQGVTAKKKEKMYLEQFSNLYNQGELTKYFIDKSEIDEILRYVESRKVKLLNVESNDLTNLNKSLKDYFYYIFLEAIAFEYEGAQVTLEINPSDKHAKIFYAINGKDFKKYSRDSSLVINDFSKPIETISIKYIDMNKVEVGPFELKFPWTDFKKKFTKGTCHFSRHYLKGHALYVYYDYLTEENYLDYRQFLHGDDNEEVPMGERKFLDEFIKGEPKENLKDCKEEERIASAKRRLSIKDEGHNQHLDEWPNQHLKEVYEARKNNGIKETYEEFLEKYDKK